MEHRGRNLRLVLPFRLPRPPAIRVHDKSHPHPTAGVGEFRRVVEQIAKDLGKSDGIGLDPERTLGQVVLKFQAGALQFGSVIFETAVQRGIEPSKLSRVSAYNWMGAMVFLPAGYAIAGPVASAIGISTSLWIGAAWLVVSTAVILSVRDVRDYGSAPKPELSSAVPVK